MKADLLFATTNPGKQKEIRSLLEDLEVRLLFLQDLAPAPEPEETGTTFEENARIKAAAYAGLLPRGYVAAEDSGLVVPALGGEPGVYSARYGGRPDDASRNAYLLERMRDLQGDARSAYYEAAVVLRCPDGREEVFMGRVSGIIAGVADGTGGFGYDPLFLHQGLGRTFGNATRAEKDHLSHRGKAVRALRDFVAEKLR
jgi:XTP/dITP diphosphohydrolase